MSLITIENVVVHEAQNQQSVAVVTVRLRSPVAQAVTVDYRTEDISASSLADNTRDYFAAQGTLTFAPNEIVKQFSIQLPRPDAQYDQRVEHLRVVLSNATNAVIANTSAIVSIVDSNNFDRAVARPQVSVRDVIVDEKAGVATFVIVSAGWRTSQNGFNVSYATAGGSATSGTDFQATSGTLLFDPEDAVKTVTVPIVDDNLAEGAEWFTLTLSNAVLADIRDGSAVAWIAPSDAPAVATPGVRVGDMFVNESDGWIDVEVSLSAPSASQVSVDYRTINITADQQDFGAEQGRLVFAPGETSRTVRVATISPLYMYDALETFGFSLTAAQGAVIDRSVGWVFMGDDDRDSLYASNYARVADVVVDETAGRVTFVVRLDSSDWTSSRSVLYTTVNGTAVAGSDFVAASGSLVFYPGETVKTITVDLIDDAVAEGAERFWLQIDEGQGARRQIAFAEIAANDAATVTLPKLTVDAPAVVDATAVYTEFAVRLDAPSSSTVTVAFRTREAGAGPNDVNPAFVSVEGRLTFTPGQTVQSVRTPLLAPNIELVLSDAMNATIDRATALAVIGGPRYAGRVGWYVGDVTVDEKAGKAVFTISLDDPVNDTTFAPFVSFATESGGSATAGSDFVARTGTLYFLPGERVKTVEIDLIDDALAEGAETFTLRLTSPYATVARAVGTATIAASDAPAVATPRLSVAPLTVLESGRWADLVVSLSAPSAQTVTVAYTTADGSAIAGRQGDYIATSGVLAFAPGQTTQVVRVLLVDDGAAEPVEAFRFDLSAAQGAVIDTPSLQVLVTDKTGVPPFGPYPEWRVRSVQVDETAGQAVFEVTLGDGASMPASGTVSVSTVDGTASAGTDYVATTATLTFLPGESVKRVVVPLIDEGVAEGAETFTLRLQSASGIPLTVDSSATATIAASDQPVVATPGVRVSEAEFVGEGQGWFDIDVALGAPSAVEITVDYSTVALSAREGTDFVAVAGRLRFAPGEVLKTVRVVLADDRVIEPREVFRFNLTGATGATIDAGSTLVTLFDNDRQDGTLELFAEPVLVDEKAGRARFVVRGGADGDTAYLYAFANFNAQLVAGDAEVGSDMLAPAGPFSFTPTQTFRVIDVPIVDDGLAEGPESFQLRLTPVPSWLRIGTEFTPATIAASDAPATANPRLRVDDVVVDERQPTARFVVALDAPSTGVVSVAWRASAASATPGVGADFFADGGTLRFAPGETVKIVQVALVDDSVRERPEQFDFVLDNASGADYARRAAVATILDNDTASASPALHVGDVLVDEKAGSAVVTVTLGPHGGQAAAGRVTVNYATAAASAAAGSDFVARGGSLTFLPGETVKTVVIDLVDDTLAEGAETFTLDLSAPTGATIAQGRGTVTIAASDQPVQASPRVSLSAAGTLVAEGVGFVDLRLSLSAPSAGITSVVPRLVPVSTVTSDFHLGVQLPEVPVVFMPGQTVATWRLPVIDDSLAESIESARVELTSPVGLTLADAALLLHLFDDDSVVTTPQLHVRDAVVDESAGVARFVVTLGRARGERSAQEVSVAYATVAAGAEPGSDFVATAGTLRFLPGESIQVVEVPLIDDAVDEGTERFQLVLSNPVGATLGDGRGVARIGPSDAPTQARPVLRLDDGAVAEGDGFVDLVATLSAPSSAPIEVAYTVAATSTEPARAGWLRFAPGTTTALLRVDIVDDAVVRDGDTRRIDLVLPPNADVTLANAVATVRVVDNDRVGTEILANGDGDDVYVVDAISDVVVEGPDQGYDRVRASVSYDLPLDVEVLELTGGEALQARGNALANLLLGNAGNNVLEGGDGDDTLDGAGGEDTLRGGAGDDRYIVDNLRDVVDESGGGRDTIVSSVTFTLPAQVEDIELAGSDAINASGNAAANRIVGNAGANALFGDTGDDTLVGGAGNDTLIGDAGADRFVFAASGNGVDIVNDWDAADRVLIEGVALSTAAPTPGNGSTVNGRRIEIGSTSGYTDLWIDTDGNAGAEIRIQVLGVDPAARFVVTNTAEGASIARVINVAPTLAVPLPDRVIMAGGVHAGVVPASTFNDANGDTLGVGAARADGSTLPAWLRFSAGASTFVGTPAAGDVGLLDVRVRATDPLGASAFDDFQVIVAPAGFNALNYTASYADLRGVFGLDQVAATRHFVNFGRFENRTVSFDPLRYTAAYGDLIASFGTDAAAAASHYITSGANEGRNLRFDGRIYWAMNPAVRAQAGTDPTALARHYIAFGAPARANFTDLNGQLYIASYGDLLTSLGNNFNAGVNHFLNFGFAEGRAVTFDPLAYIASYVDLIQGLGANATSGLNHYFANGFAEGRRVSFDPLRYTASYGDLINAFGTNENASASHFIVSGFGEGRQSGFDPRQYWAMNQAARADAGTNPRELARHFISSGFAAGAPPVLDGLRYIASYGDLAAAFGLNATAGLNHFLASGFAEGRAVTFDPWRYLASNGDLAAALGTNLTAATQHYITTGRSENRSLSSFDAWQYMLANLDVRNGVASNIDAATRHFVATGRTEGRTTTLAQINGSANPDTLIGTSASERIAGGAGNDVLDGGAGNDLIVGGAGSDIATGGAGADVFSFATPGEGADAITDFTSGTDVLLFSSAGFAGLAQGRLDASRLAGSSAELGTGAGFVYDPLTGSLSFDPDGAGALAPTAIVGLGANRNLAPTDIFVGP